MNERLSEVLKKRETKMSEANTTEKTETEETVSYGDYVEAALQLMGECPPLEHVIDRESINVDYSDLFEHQSVDVKGEGYDGAGINGTLHISMEGNVDVDLEDYGVETETVRTIIQGLSHLIDPPTLGHFDSHHDHHPDSPASPPLNSAQMMMHVCADALGMQDMLRYSPTGDDRFATTETSSPRQEKKALSDEEIEVPGMSFEIRLNGNISSFMEGRRLQSVRHLSSEMRLGESLIELHKSKAMDIENLCEFVLDFIRSEIRSEKGGE
tara:strand:+ start:2203 stop:3009 length:807 start_codon:yes stop_codon:yes gene_type:complete